MTLLITQNGHVFVKHFSDWSLTLLFVLHFKSLTYQIRSKKHYVINHYIISKRHWAIDTQNTKQIIESWTNLKNIWQRDGPFSVINRIRDQIKNLVQRQDLLDFLVAKKYIVNVICTCCMNIYYTNDVGQHILTPSFKKKKNHLNTKP